MTSTGFFAWGAPFQSKADSALLAGSFRTAGGRIFIDSDVLPSNTYYVYYKFQNSYNAISIHTHAILVNPSPNAIFTSSNNCVVSAVNFTDHSTIDASSLPYTTSIVSYIWDFGDGSPKQYFSNPFTSTSYKYAVANNYNVTLQVTTDKGCTKTSAPYQLKVGDPPTPLFTWSSICTNDSTKFDDKSNPGVVSVITNYQWDFGDGTIINGSPGTTIVDTKTGGKFEKPNHKYTTNGVYPVKITVTNDNGCFDTSPAKKVFILPYSTITPLPTSAYKQDFQVNDGGWVPEAFNATNSTPQDTIPSDTSWVWSIPNGLRIQPTALTDKSWWTGKNSNSYFINENSVVNGPCFNLSQLNRAMFSLDYWTDAEENSDGTVLQISIDRGNNWQIVGPLAGLPVALRDQGINWYNPGAVIVSNPGEQPFFGPYGWTGKAGQWLSGKYNLDGILPIAKRNQVRFRLAFASHGVPSAGLKYDGFAFDNVFVGDKTKNVLVEQITNANSSTSGAADVYFANLYTKQVTQRNGSTDFNYIQYHVRFPQPDVFSQANGDDAAARALYYSVQTPPYSMLDGIQTNKLP